MEKALYSKAGARLREFLIDSRQRAGLTQVQVAGHLRKAQSFVSHYENGLRRLDVVEFLEVAKVLRADPSTIIGELMDLC